MFIVGREELYKYQHINSSEDDILKFILRTTSGVFSEYRPIDENLIARSLNLPRQTVYDLILKLARDKIISYIPQKSLPQIYYPEERLPQKSLYFGPERYLNRKELYVEKINAVIRYATEHECRVQQLLHYFGMADVPMCGTCDVCTHRHETDMTEFEFQTIKNLIDRQITAEPTSISSLPDKIGKEQKKVGRVARWLLDNNYLAETDNGQLKNIEP